MASHDDGKEPSAKRARKSSPAPSAIPDVLCGSSDHFGGITVVLERGPKVDDHEFKPLLEREWVEQRADGATCFVTCTRETPFES